MASGGSIPSNRTQAVTFYNTTGLIEKEKGIYLSPRFKNRTADIGREVRAVYLDILNAEAVKDPDYENIDVSSWSPQDRDLTVKGNIDDFRLVTDEGDCLNYLIITRNVTKGNVTNTYYYGFFITDVKQAGGASIRLTVEPDDFTNIFYLHNKHTVSSYDVNYDYDPFNERMKNCYVQRQHYDRVFKQLGGYWFLSIKFTDISMSEGEIQIGDEVNLLLGDSGQATEIAGNVDYVDDRGLEQHELLLRIKTSQKTDIGEPENFSELVHSGNFYQCDYDFDSIEWERIADIIPVNNHVFLNQEESYKFKYQFKDMKFPICKINNVNFASFEVNAIKSTSAFDLLSSDLQNKIIKTCISYVVLQTKSNEGISYLWNRFDNQSPYAKYQNYAGRMVGGVESPSYFLASPILVVPKEFEKYRSYLENHITFYYSISKNGTDWFDSGYPLANVLYMINTNSMADFVYSCYLASDIGIRDEDVVITVVNNHWRVKFKLMVALDSGTARPDGIYLSGFYRDITYAEDNLKGIFITGGPNPNDPIQMFSYDGVHIMIAFQSTNMKEIDITVSENLPDVHDIKNVFYDPVLESEPYSFYSMSIYGSEMVFNKNRYYVGIESHIKVEYSITYNGGIKMVYVPKYTVEGYETRYFNEGITMTVTSQFPLLSDSYSTYYYQNMSQMKNQFAVNDYNRGVDLAQHFFLSGPNAVGQQAFRRGWQGAVAETINQFAQMGDEMIDWGQSNKVIEMNQKARLADMGRKPDNLKQAGSDVYADLESKEFIPFLNHYRIDELSYNSIAKYLERFGYQANLYTSLNVNNRVGWNFVKLISFDWNPAYDIMVGQEENLRKIFSEGVTLLHDKSYLTSGHNYETILDE